MNCFGQAILKILQNNYIKSNLGNSEIRPIILNLLFIVNYFHHKHVSEFKNKF